MLRFLFSTINVTKNEKEIFEKAFNFGLCRSDLIKPLMYFAFNIIFNGQRIAHDLFLNCIKTAFCFKKFMYLKFIYKKYMINGSQNNKKHCMLMKCFLPQKIFERIHIMTKNSEQEIIVYTINLI